MTPNVSPASLSEQLGHDPNVVSGLPSLVFLLNNYSVWAQLCSTSCFLSSYQRHDLAGKLGWWEFSTFGLEA